MKQSNNCSPIAKPLENASSGFFYILDNLNQAYYDHIMGDAQAPKI